MLWNRREESLPRAEKRWSRFAFRSYKKEIPEEKIIGDVRYFRDKENNLRLRGIYLKTGTPCSCPMCGNPRKWFKHKTIQEQKFEEYFNDSIDELSESENILFLGNNTTEEIAENKS